ncbi:polysaccharide deacetylase family protein [Shouchella patagoniensis]|uniref:polysaccharide deacetylase family protein n=1 Tax=Shouchella patagoniensis TaxID=228576 RepID=UPI000995BDA5|nr:polysaccharide deacetylase family protein [Shouchella patagoniensis]
MWKKGICVLVIVILVGAFGLDTMKVEAQGGKDKMDRQTVPLPTLQTEFPGVVFVKGDSASNQIALTFDDGPDPRFTGQVLEKLEAYNVPATFFVLGERVTANPDLLRRVIDGGHEIGNHTYSHLNLAEASVAQLEQELTETGDAVEAITGYRPSLFRPPYGFITREQVERLASLNYSVIGWDVDPLDWDGTPAAQVAQTVLQEAGAGSIILLHDGGDVDTENPEIFSADALDEIIPALQNQGYTFVTVSELLDVSRSE